MLNETKKHIECVEMDVRFKNLQDRRNKEHNIFLSLKERAEANGQINKQEDKSDLHELLRSLDVNDVQLRAHFSLGVYNQSKTRPIIAVIEDKTKRRLLLNNATYIKDKARAPAHLKCAILARDRTKLENEQKKSLLAQKAYKTTSKEIDELPR